MQHRGQDGKGVISKWVHRIRKFTSTDPDYKWAHFWAQYSVAVQNAAYKDYELCMIFLSCLDGPAPKYADC
jgi:hypothetical protein